MGLRNPHSLGETHELYFTLIFCEAGYHSIEPVPSYQSVALVLNYYHFLICFRVQETPMADTITNVDNNTDELLEDDYVSNSKLLQTCMQT